MAVYFYYHLLLVQIRSFVYIMCVTLSSSSHINYGRFVVHMLHLFECLAYPCAVGGCVCIVLNDKKPQQDGGHWKVLEEVNIKCNYLRVCCKQRRSVIRAYSLIEDHASCVIHIYLISYWNKIFEPRIIIEGYLWSSSGSNYLSSSIPVGKLRRQTIPSRPGLRIPRVDEGSTNFLSLISWIHYNK